MTLLILSICLLTMTACGKTLDQVQKTAKEAVDIAGKVYEDVVDNMNTVMAPEKQ